MQYNTQKTPIEIAEYGRNIQQLLLRANDIANHDERLAYVEKVLDVMYAVDPQVRITEDYRSKLWSHAFRITNYTLEVQLPDGIVLDEQADFFHKRPKSLTYPVNLVKFRHYGKNITTLIAKAIATEDADKRAEFTAFIAAFMKMAQINYNREGVTDDLIRRDLRDLSNGKLSLDAEANIEDIARGNRVALTPEKPKTRRGKRGGKNKKQTASDTITTLTTNKNDRNNTQNNTQNTSRTRNAAPQNTPKKEQTATPKTQNTLVSKQRNQTPKKEKIENVAKAQTPKPQVAKAQPEKITTPKPPTDMPQTNNTSDIKKPRRRGGRGRGGKGKKTE